MVREFNDVVLTEEAGVVHGSVKTQFGYHLIQTAKPGRRALRRLTQTAYAEWPRGRACQKLARTGAARLVEMPEPNQQ
jgi:hypothetical protein